MARGHEEDRVKCKMLNVKAIIVSKMMSHCVDTVQNERRVRKRDKKVRRDVI